MSRLTAWLVAAGLLLATAAGAESFSFPDGTGITVPSSFRRNDSGTEENFRAWAHKQNSWAVSIANYTYDAGVIQKFYDAEKKRLEGEGAVITDTWAGGAQIGFRAEKKQPREVVVYVISPTRKTVSLRFQNTQNQAPEGFDYVVTEVIKSFHLGR